MTVTYKTIAIVLSSLAIVCFALGRYTNRGAPEVKTEEQVTKNQQVDKDKNTKTHTVETTVKQKDGTVKTITVTDIDTVSTVNKTTATKTDKTSDIIPPKSAVANISLLVSNDFAAGKILPAYGLSVQKEILGPITIGAFGLTSGVLGLSLGVNF